jgi:hypothetical protein
VSVSVVNNYTSEQYVQFINDEGRTRGIKVAAGGSFPLSDASWASIPAQNKGPGKLVGTPVSAGGGVDFSTLTWLPIPLVNGYRVYVDVNPADAGTFDRPQYAVGPGFIYFKGLVDGAQAANMIWGQLPNLAGHRPTHTRSFLQITDVGIQHQVIRPDGTCGPWNGQIPGFVYTEGMVLL